MAAHVVVRGVRNPDGSTTAAACLHCGASLAVVFPLSTRVFVAMSNAFVKEHAKCPKPAGIIDAPTAPDGAEEG